MHNIKRYRVECRRVAGTRKQIKILVIKNRVIKNSSKNAGEVKIKLIYIASIIN
jgi:hypothetical protein